MKKIFLLKKKKRKKKKKPRLSQTKLREWANKVKEKAGYKCKSCGIKKNLHAHHMVSKYYRPVWAYDISNGISLCASCHLKRGGVHHKASPPKNNLIKKLRLIFKLNDINAARKISNIKNNKIPTTQKRVKAPTYKKKLKKRLKRRL